MGSMEDPFEGYMFHKDENSSDYTDWKRRILLASIVSLSMVLMFIVFLHIYARYVINRRQALRRAAIHRLTVTVAQSQSQTHPDQQPPPNQGLDPTVIASLPMFIFKRQAQASDDSSSIECAVCLSTIEDGEKARFLPRCNHTFHIECIDTWLASQSTCPICRTKAEPVLEPQPREGPIGLVHPPMAQPLEPAEGTSDGGGSAKINGSTSNSRLSSFRRMLSRDRSSRRTQPSSQDHNNNHHHHHDVERQ